MTRDKWKKRGSETYTNKCEMAGCENNEIETEEQGS